MENKALVERFLRYVVIDTQSDEEAEQQPSTDKQRDLAKVLIEDLKAVGAEVDYDETYNYIYAKIAAVPAEGQTAEDLAEPIGFIAHMDTAPACSGTNVKARIIENFQGQDDILKIEDFPELANHIGEDLIATDGTTLLGADDKAGVAEILEMAAYYHAHPELPHREIWIGYTPDEEVGRGTEHFDTSRFGAKIAYTVDGGKMGILEYECFNAAGAKIEIEGKSVHPGSAKNTMINACQLAFEFNSMLPAAEVPEHTEGYEGFYHLCEMAGSEDHMVMKYIVRDHDRRKFEARKKTVEAIVAYLNEKYPSHPFHLELHDQYFNMVEVMKDHMELIENAEKALRELGVEPKTEPIRGGTDGAALSFMGIPCPNLCTGGYNYHSRFEYASIQEMELTMQLLIKLAA